MKIEDHAVENQKRVTVSVTQKSVTSIQIVLEEGMKCTVISQMVGCPQLLLFSDSPLRLE